MCYSNHSGFLSKDESISNNPKGENHEKITPKRRVAGLKGGILHRAIIDNLYKRKLL